MVAVLRWLSANCRCASSVTSVMIWWLCPVDCCVETGLLGGAGVVLIGGVRGLVVPAGTPDTCEPEPGAVCQSGFLLPVAGCGGGCGMFVAVVLIVMPLDGASFWNRLIGISQWPDAAFFIWKCRDPGLGVI